MLMQMETMTIMGRMTFLPRVSTTVAPRRAPRDCPANITSPSDQIILPPKMKNKIEAMFDARLIKFEWICALSILYPHSRI